MKERMSKMKAKSKDFIRGFMGMFGRDGRLSEFFHDQKTRLSAAFSSPQLEWVDTSSEEEEYWDSFNGERSHSPQSGFQGASEDCQAPSDRQSRSGADVD